MRQAINQRTVLWENIFQRGTYLVAPFMSSNETFKNDFSYTTENANGYCLFESRVRYLSDNMLR